jgi:aspartyl/asparaginyl beta-hydroxylase (cupin superfamily)
MQNSSVETLVQAASRARMASDFETARSNLDAAIKLSPKDPALRNLAGNLELDAALPAAAAARFREALELDPKAAILWNNLARACRDTGDEAGEKQALEGALNIDQLNIIARVRRAEWYDRNGMQTDGFRDWTGVAQMLVTADTAQPGLAELLDRANKAIQAYRARFEALVEPAIRDELIGRDEESTRRFNVFFNAALGRRKVYRNECAGLMFPMLPADEFFPRSHFSWMDALESQAEAVRHELEQLLDAGGDGFSPYVSMPPGTPENKWSPLNNSSNWDAGYLWKYGEPSPGLIARCPATVKALSEIARFDPIGRGPTAFFSLLRPHAHIPPHTGVSNMRTIVHLPLIVPEDCWFRVGGETRPWVSGKPFAFDDTIEHEAFNGSDHLRAVLIFDVWNPHMSELERDMMRKFYATADAAGIPQERQFDG